MSSALPQIQTLIDLSPSLSDMKTLVPAVCRLVSRSLSHGGQATTVALMGLRAMIAAATHPYGNALLVDAGLESEFRYPLDSLVEFVSQEVKTTKSSLLAAEVITEFLYI